MEHSQPIHLSTVYGLSEIWPQKTKYLLCSLLQKSPPTTALHHWPQSFNVCQMATLYLVTCIVTALASFHLPISLLLISIGFCYYSFNDLGSVFIRLSTMLHSALRTCTEIIMVYILMLDMMLLLILSFISLIAVIINYLTMNG